MKESRILLLKAVQYDNLIDFSQQKLYEFVLGLRVKLRP